MTAGIAILAGMPLETRFLLFALTLAARFGDNAIGSRPLQHDAFLVLCLEWLYAVGCWGLVVTWASFAGAAVAATFGW